MEEEEKGAKPGSDHDVWMTLLNEFFFFVGRKSSSVKWRSRPYRLLKSLKKKKRWTAIMSGWTDCLTLANQTIVLGGMFQPGEMDSANVERKNFLGEHCVTTWRCTGVRMATSSEFHVIMGSSIKNWQVLDISLKAVEYKTREPRREFNICAMSAFPFRNGSTTPPLSRGVRPF